MKLPFFADYLPELKGFSFIYYIYFKGPAPFSLLLVSTNYI